MQINSSKIFILLFDVLYSDIFSSWKRKEKSFQQVVHNICTDCDKIIRSALLLDHENTQSYQQSRWESNWIALFNPSENILHISVIKWMLSISKLNFERNWNIPTTLGVLNEGYMLSANLVHCYLFYHHNYSYLMVG